MYISIGCHGSSSRYTRMLQAASELSAARDCKARREENLFRDGNASDLLLTPQGSNSIQTTACLHSMELYIREALAPFPGLRYSPPAPRNSASTALRAVRTC